MPRMSPIWAASAVEAPLATDDRPFLTRNQKQKPHTEYGVRSRLILTPSSYAFCEFSNSEDSKHPGLARLILATTQRVEPYLQRTPYGGCTSAFSQVLGSCMTRGVGWKTAASNRSGFGGEENGPADRQHGRRVNSVDCFFFLCSKNITTLGTYRHT